jgi:hypothetical protein
VVLAPPAEVFLVLGAETVRTLPSPEPRKDDERMRLVSTTAVWASSVSEGDVSSPTAGMAKPFPGLPNVTAEEASEEEAIPREGGKLDTADNL